MAGLAFSLEACLAEAPAERRGVSSGIGFAWTVAWFNWTGVVGGAGVLVAVLAIDLFLKKFGPETVSAWIWPRFNRVKGWQVLAGVLLASAVRPLFSEPPAHPCFLPCFLLTLGCYLVIGGHTLWDDFREGGL